MGRRPKRRTELLHRGSLDNCHLCGRFNFLTIRGQGGSGGGGGGIGTGAGQGSGGSGTRSSRILPLNNVRSVILSDKKRRVSATPELAGNMELVVYEAGADTDRELKVVKSSNGNVRNGIIRNLKAKRGNRITLDIELDTAFHGAMKVAAYAI